METEDRAADQIVSPATTERNPIDLASHNDGSVNPALIASISSARGEGQYTERLREMKREKSLYYEKRGEVDPEQISSDILKIHMNSAEKEVKRKLDKCDFAQAKLNS